MTRKVQKERCVTSFHRHARAPRSTVIGDLSHNSTAMASSSDELFRWVFYGSLAYGAWLVARASYKIRMVSIDDYGPVIHEFE